VRIIVCVAATPNPDKVKWDRFRQLLDLQDAEPVLNPVDRHALELAATLAKQTGSTFDAVCAGSGASAALREAAVFGADRLVAVADDALETADEAGIAAALTATIAYLGGADIVFCGSSTASFGSGAVPGYVSARLDAGLLVDALGAQIDDGLIVTLLAPGRLWHTRPTLPAVVTAAPFGIKVRTISPLLLMKAAKKTTISVSLRVVGCETPLATTGTLDGPLESNRSKKGMEVIDGDDASTRAITLVGALRARRVL
jgi:electron transfer flavoprotein alpha/beta subunit